MQKFFRRLDEIAQINQENKLAGWLERIAFVFLVLMVLAAPHSIAATQTAWLLGMTAQIARLFIKPRPRLVRTPLDAALWAFFFWSLLTSIFSYAPDISLDKMRGVALFLIFYTVVNIVKNSRAVCFLALALIASCMVNVLYTGYERVAGRGVEIYGVAADGPLAKLTLRDGDTILRADGKKVATPEDLLEKVERGEIVKIEFYRPDYYLIVDLKRENLLAGAGSAAEKLGFQSWKKSRNWRSMGFYGHWTTYAEVLQLVASLTFGLLIAAIAGNKYSTQRRRDAEKNKTKKEGEQSPLFSYFLISLLSLCLGGMLFALLLTATRASQAGFLAAAFAIVLLVGNRKMLLALAAAILPLAILGFIILQQSRNVGFVDEKDVSTQYRQTIYREGFELWTADARNFLLGVGMDSIKRYAGEWRLFDDGRLPMGHFHSTPLQLVVERGLPALLLWLWIVWIYGRILLRGIQDSRFKIQDSRFKIQDLRFKISNSKTENPKSEIPNPKSETGVLLGSFGALVGFFAGGAVHYNLGDQEVAMIFFLLMGLSVKLISIKV
jgi:O-antigen ligase